MCIDFKNCNFPGEQKKIYLHITDATRIKPIYKDFDANYFKAKLSILKSNIEKYSGDLLAENVLERNLKDYINIYLLKSDDTVLQFTDIFSTLNVFPTIEKAIEEYTKLLLPLSIKEESKLKRKSPDFPVLKLNY